MTREVSVVIDGAPVQVPAGATVAAALGRLPGGVARTSVQGQRRAPLCGMGVCHECRVDIDGWRRLACQTTCADGMRILTGGGSVAGLPPESGGDRRCDLLIVGAGPAGLSAALAAGRSGARIVLLDDNPLPGGQVWRDGPSVALPAAARRLRAAVEALPHVEVRCATRVVGLAGPRALMLEDARAGWAQHFDKLILCTGARELLLPFPGWTLPGVTGAGGLQALVKGGLDVRGQRVVVAGSGPLLLAAAGTARRAGAQVACMAEQAGAAAMAMAAAALWRWPGKAAQAASLWRPGLSAGTWVVEAHGDSQLRAVTLRRGERTWEVSCDRLACGFGLVPNTGLGEALGCRLNALGGLQVDDDQATGADGVHAAGECTGIGGGERARVQGAIAGHAAAGEPELARKLWPQRARWQRFADTMREAFALRDAVRHLAAPDTLLCRCEDVTLRDVAACDGWVDAKLHTRCGMGACQGRTCGAAARQLFGWSVPSPQQMVSPARMATLTAVDPGGPGD